MNAYGLGDMTYAKGLMQKVLEQGTSSSSALANTLDNSQILAFAKAFDFADNGTSTTSTTAVQTGVVNNYINQTLDTNEGKSQPGVQLALYFQQNASSITSVYQILADKNLLSVVQTALGISSSTSEEDVDTQANMLSSRLNLSDFQDPKKLQTFIERFSVLYDENNSSSSTQSWSVPNALLSTSSSTTTFSTSLLSSMQGIGYGSF
jgi:hypothetical protein